MEEGTMGNVIEMRVEIKEEVDPIDRANNSQSVETTMEKGPWEIEVGRISKDFVDIVGCKGTKHQIAPSGNKVWTSQWKQRREPEEQLFQLWEARTLQQKLPREETKQLGLATKLFVGYAGEDCVYMAQDKQQAHKTNRDWHLDTSYSDNSNNNMNLEEDSDTSVTTFVTSNNTIDNNNHIITCDNHNETEDYEATDPDNFEAKFTDIASWTHDDLVHNTVLGVNTFMIYWH
jgi:hypothetical protein